MRRKKSLGMDECLLPKNSSLFKDPGVFSQHDGATPGTTGNFNSGTPGTTRPVLCLPYLNEWLLLVPLPGVNRLYTVSFGG